MKRDEILDRAVHSNAEFDVVVIGGGATGAGIALDAASRGLAVLLVEQSDFGSGTSSRSTKIIHGGVRYLAQGNVSLVREALRERSRLLNNAPDIVKPLQFAVPVDSVVEYAKYRIGLRLYDALSGSHSLERSAKLSDERLDEIAEHLVPLQFRSVVTYSDAQFDDARLVISVLQTATKYGALCLNYAKVAKLNHDRAGRLRAIDVIDEETGTGYEFKAKAFVNATGASSDHILKLDNAEVTDTILPSQGAHIVVPRTFLPIDFALLMPKTPDGRVMFAIPWFNHTIIGTTDTELDKAIDAPRPFRHEVDAILDVCRNYLREPPGRNDVLSTFAGIRPLVRSPKQTRSASVSREHRFDVLDSGLVTVSGGKWTTYRLMAEGCVDLLARLHHWSVEESPTRDLRLQGSNDTDDTSASDVLLDPALPYTEQDCRRAIRHEWARTAEDILARRTRALFLNVAAARRAAPRVIEYLAEERGLDALETRRLHDRFESATLEFQELNQ